MRDRGWVCEHSAALLLVLALLVFGVLGGSSANATTSAPVMAASEIAYPPFSIVEANGQAGGFSVELMRAALAAMGREVSFRTGPWADVRGWLESGEVQALPLVGRTPEREALYDFTFPYMSLYGAIVVRDDNTDIQDIASLRGRDVAVMLGDNAEEYLRREDRGIEIHTTATFEEALQGLSDGQYDAVVIQHLVAVRLIQEAGLENLRVIPEPIDDYRQDWCFAVKDGDKDTLALLNEGLALVMADGTYQRLYSKWFAALELPNRRIVVGGDYDYPPYEYLDENGRPAGYNVELTRAIAEAVGLDVEIRLGPWSEAREGLVQGEIDILQGMFYSRERDLTFDFSQPHAVANGVAIVREGEGDPPATLDDLKGKSIVVQQGDIMHDFAVANGLTAQIVAVESPEEALREVAEGRYDCVLMSRVVALYTIEQEGWTDLVVGKSSLLSSEYCYAVANGQTALLAEFAEGLKVLQDNGEYRRIYEKWMGVYEESSPTPLAILRYVAYGVGPLLVLLLVALFWTRFLRRQVARRTEALRSSEEQYRLLADNAGDVIWMMDPEGHLTYVSPSVEKLRGYTTAEVLQGSLEELLTPESAAIALPRLAEAMAAAQSGRPSPEFRSELEQPCKDGSTVWTEMRVSELRNSAGEWVGFLGVTRDITERKQAEEWMRELALRQQAILAAVPDILMEVDSDKIYRWANHAGLEFFGEDVIGREARFYFEAEQDTYDVVAPLFNGREDLTYVESWQRRKDGETRLLAWLCRGLRDGAGNVIGAISSALDITERKQAEEALKKSEEQLRQSQKMEAVGQLAGGIAHDFNNLLTAILGYSNLLLEGADLPDPARADLEEIKQAAERAGALTKQILAFSRRQALRPDVVSLNEVLSGVESLLRRTLGEHIDLVTLPHPDLGHAEIDVHQFEQVLMNLALNARDAMPAGGRLTLETANVELDEEFCRTHPEVTPGRYVMLAVSDTGFGMDEATLAHAFEPFFTTKGPGEGTGLGLATAYGIVTQSRGSIFVYSRAGQGTTFKIYLPRVTTHEAAETLVIAEHIPSFGSEKIMVVEDESALRSLIERVLVSAGYKVICFGTADEALIALEQGQIAVDLLLTDVVLPGVLQGKDLVDMVQISRPDVPVLYMSGYTRDAIVHAGRLDEGVNFLEKPFTPEALVRMVREVLDGPRTSGR
jgi:PAS domain S-box-containing protein